MITKIQPCLVIIAVAIALGAGQGAATANAADETAKPDGPGTSPQRYAQGWKDTPEGVRCIDKCVAVRSDQDLVCGEVPDGSDDWEQCQKKNNEEQDRCMKRCEEEYGEG